MVYDLNYEAGDLELLLARERSAAATILGYRLWLTIMQQPKALLQVTGALAMASMPYLSCLSSSIALLCLVLPEV